MNSDNVTIFINPNSRNDIQKWVWGLKREAALVLKIVRLLITRKGWGI